MYWYTKEILLYWTHITLQGEWRHLVCNNTLLHYFIASNKYQLVLNTNAIHLGHDHGQTNIAYLHNMDFLFLNQVMAILDIIDTLNNTDIHDNADINDNADFHDKTDFRNNADFHNADFHNNAEF